MSNARLSTEAERRQIEARLERLRECAKCSKAACGCDRVEIEIAELERRLRQLTEEAT